MLCGVYGKCCIPDWDESMSGEIRQRETVHGAHCVMEQLGDETDLLRRLIEKSADRWKITTWLAWAGNHQPWPRTKLGVFAVVTLETHTCVTPKLF